MYTVWCIRTLTLCIGYNLFTWYVLRCKCRTENFLPTRKTKSIDSIYVVYYNVRWCKIKWVNSNGDSRFALSIFMLYIFNWIRAISRWQHIQNFLFVTIKTTIFRDKNEMQIDEKRKSWTLCTKRKYTMHHACDYVLQVKVDIRRCRHTHGAHHSLFSFQYLKSVNTQQANKWTLILH